MLFAILDIKRFCTGCRQQDKEIDGKVCNKKVWAKGTTNTSAVQDPEDGRWSCNDYTPGGDVDTHNKAQTSPEGRGFVWRFGEVTKKKERHNEHATADKGNTAENIGYADSGWPGTGSGENMTQRMERRETSASYNAPKNPK